MDCLFSYWVTCKQRTNYNFEFEAGLNLDATEVGNHTRFLNDAVKPTKEGIMVQNEDALNCFARRELKFVFLNRSN